MSSYNQLCGICKRRYVLMTVGNKSRFPVCSACQMKQIEEEIKDEDMKKFFDIPIDFYKKNDFLRSIKLNFLRYGNLTEKQTAAFLENVEKMKSFKEEDKKE